MRAVQSLMHRRGYFLSIALTCVAAGCSQPRPDSAASPHLGRASLGDASLPAGSHGERLSLRDCPGGLTADDCERVESAILALERHPDPGCRAVGDSATARLFRGRMEFVQPTLSGMGYRRGLDGNVVMAQRGVAMIGAGQFDGRGVLIEAIARALTTDSLKPDSVAAKCRRSA